MLKAVSNLWSRWSEFVWTSTIMKPSQSYTACDSPECVRCNRYQQVREEAWGKLQSYAEKNGWQGLDQIVMAIGEGKRYREVRDRLATNKDSLVPAPLQNPNVLYVPTLEKKVWWDVDKEEGNKLASEAMKIEGYFKDILREFDHVYKLISDEDDLVHEKNELVKCWKRNTTEQGSWCVFHLYNQGEKVVKNCELCPRTTSIIESLPSAMNGSLFGNACFSVVFPETKITEHYGPCNVRIRCHLGLKVPDDCTLTVGKEVRPWVEGQTLLFDDSFLHSAINENSTEVRAVFMVDLWHPDITPKEREALLNIF